MKRIAAILFAALVGYPAAAKKIKVAVIDSGIDYAHPDLASNYIGGDDFVNFDGDHCDVRFHTVRPDEEWIGPDLDMHRHRVGTFAAFVEPGRPITRSAPQAPRLPAAVDLADDVRVRDARVFENQLGDSLGNPPTTD